MRYLVILGLLAFGLGACGATSTLVGPGAYSIECKRNRGECYQEAGRVCPQGFDVRDGSEQNGVYVQSQTYGNNTQTTAFPTYSGTMLVQCKSGEQAAQ
jgi:hypothetical protein